MSIRFLKTFANGVLVLIVVNSLQFHPFREEDECPKTYKPLLMERGAVPAMTGAGILQREMEVELLRNYGFNDSLKKAGSGAGRI